MSTIRRQNGLRIVQIGRAESDGDGDGEEAKIPGAPSEVSEDPDNMPEVPVDPDKFTDEDEPW